MENEIIDVAEHHKNGKPVPAGKSYKIIIDKESYILHTPIVTGRQLLELAKKLPVERFAIYLKEGRERTRIQLDEKIDISDRKVERFVTLPLDQTEG